MPARTRTKRRSALPPLKLSTLRPHLYNIRPGEVTTVVCPDCRTWQRIMGIEGGTRTIRDHYSTDLSGAELEAGQRDTRCPSARRIVEIDVLLARWARDIEEGSTETAARRPTTVLRKVKAPTPRAVLHIAQGRPAGPTESARPAARKRARGWETVRVDVLVTDAVREQPLYGARGPLFSLGLPDGVATEPPRKHRKRRGRLASA
ncbi:hypothetical protein ACFVXH_39765 [Kitasatospora sp. NPDC058184]|uniref:hypothetical protein n=1 Tax=Kitasatospora sp. NPDC058184 TaxID=3346370 RepID=UPI0036D78025